MMPDDLEQQGDEAPAAMEPAPSVEPTGDDELASLLAEFDKQSAEQNPDEANPPDSADNPLDAAVDDIERAYDGNDSSPLVFDPDKRERTDAMEGDIALLTRWAAEVDLERRQAAETADKNALLSMAREQVADLDHLPPGYAEDWILAQYVKSDEFRTAWDSRYESGRARKRVQNVVRRSLRELRKSARAMPDRQATEDRALVTQAVRAGAQAAPPPKPPTDFASLDDKQFADAVEKQFGFRPLT